MSDIVLLDCGSPALDAHDVREALSALAANALPLLGADRNAYCHLWQVAAASGPRSIVIKQPRPGGRRTNPDLTFSGELRALQIAAQAAVPNVPRHVGRVRRDETHFLFLGFQPGAHPCPTAAPFTPAQLCALVDQLWMLDRIGLMHYDLKSGNLLLYGSETSILDFEFARMEERELAYSTGTRRHFDDFNTLANPHFPMRSNVANFEFRTLHRYISELARAEATAAMDLLRTYLGERATFHLSLAEYLSTLRAGDFNVAPPSLTMVKDQLMRAVRHEQAMATLMRAPHTQVCDAEFQLMGLRRVVFESGPGGRQAALRAAMQLAKHCRQMPSSIFESYVHGLMGAVARILHSWEAMTAVGVESAGHSCRMNSTAREAGQH
jgi:hypothetical protein